MTKKKSRLEMIEFFDNLMVRGATTKRIRRDAQNNLRFGAGRVFAEWDEKEGRRGLTRVGRIPLSAVMAWHEVTEDEPAPDSSGA